MARIVSFQGGSIQPDAPNVVPIRAPDFGPGVGPGVEKLGEAVGETAQKVDEIQDVGARIEANRLSIAYNNLSTNISQRVRSTLGESAEAAADKGVADLQKGASDILGGASPRAKKILEPEFATRTNENQQQWWEHGFEQKKQAFDTSSQAANDTDLQTALEQSTDAAAAPYINSIKQRNAQRSQFFGLGPEWESGENRKSVSSFFKSRALTLGVNSASDAIKYATDHRDQMDDGDFSAIVRTYRDEALDERAEVEALGYGRSADDAPTVTHDDGTTHKGADPATVFKGLILPNEGSKLVSHDSNGAPVKYGINQKANPDVDVASLTQDGAEKLFVSRYWNPSGADKLSPALAVVHADTYYLNPGEATKILRESGGDVQKYIDLRNNFLASLHASNPAKYPDYTDRNQRVEQFAASVGGDGTPFTFTGNISDKTSMSAVEDEVMARTDIPLALKTRILGVVRQRREMMRDDKRQTEDDARDSLITETTKLGDNFTSVKQLPQDVLTRASPETVHSLTEMAKNNGYRKNDEALRPYLTVTQVTDPQKFMSGDFITELMRKGASPSLISDVQTQQATILRHQTNAQPDVVSTGELWTLAKPAFEAGGLDFSSKPSDSMSKKQGQATRQQQAVTFLHGLATEWANANPGKKPTEDVMRQWIGTSMLKTRDGTNYFEANDAQVYNSLSDPIRNTVIRDLRRGGVTSQGTELVSDVANYWRKLRANYGTAPITLGGGKIRGQRLTGIDRSGFAQAMSDADQ